MLILLFGSSFGLFFFHDIVLYGNSLLLAFLTDWGKVLGVWLNLMFVARTGHPIYLTVKSSFI